MVTVNEDHMIYMVPEIKGVTDRKTFWATFCLFSPLTTRKIKILKLKKTLEHIIILHICTINENHDVWFLSYGAPQTEFFCHSGLFLALLSPYGPRKSKFWKNEQNTWYYHFTNVYHKWKSYDLWFLRYGVQQIEFFVIFNCFWPFTPPTTQKIKILKKWKKPGDIIILHRCTKNNDHMMYGCWNMVRNRCTDRWTNGCTYGQTEKVKYRGGLHWPMIPVSPPKSIRETFSLKKFFMGEQAFSIKFIGGYSTWRD